MARLITSTPKSPPENLSSLKPLIEPVTGTWYRVTRRLHSKDVHFFSMSEANRFSSSTAKFGVSYYGATPEAAFSESVRSSARIDSDKLNGPILEDLDLHEVTISVNDTEASENGAIALYSTGCERIRAKLEYFCVSTRDGYIISQEWGRALMHLTVPHCGLLYQANNAGDLCFGLYGQQGGKGAQARLAKGLELKKVRSFPLLESYAFLQWVRDCSYSIAYRATDVG